MVVLCVSPSKATLSLRHLHVKSRIVELSAESGLE
jgi:hypothetical protein